MSTGSAKISWGTGSWQELQNPTEEIHERIQLNLFDLHLCLNNLPFSLFSLPDQLTEQSNSLQVMTESSHPPPLIAHLLKLGHSFVQASRAFEADGCFTGDSRWLESSHLGIVRLLVLAVRGEQSFLVGRFQRSVLIRLTGLGEL